MAADAKKNRDGIELRKCSLCGFVFSAYAEYRYEELFNNSFVGKSKDELLAHASVEGIDKLVQELLHTIRIEKGARVLDFGAGVGLMALKLQEHGMSVAAVEESRKYVERHKSFGISSFRSLDEAISGCGAMDLIVMKDVLEHVGDPRGLLSQVLAGIKPGGYLYIRVPNVYAYRFHWTIDTRGHINHFTPRHLAGLLEENAMRRVSFVGVYDVRSRVGKVYHSIFWRLRNVVPLYHQISMVFQKPV